MTTNVEAYNYITQYNSEHRGHDGWVLEFPDIRLVGGGEEETEEELKDVVAERIRNLEERGGPVPYPFNAIQRYGMRILSEAQQGDLHGLIDVLMDDKRIPPWEQKFVEFIHGHSLVVAPNDPEKPDINDVFAECLDGVWEGVYGAMQARLALCALLCVKKYTRWNGESPPDWLLRELRLIVRQGLHNQLRLVASLPGTLVDESVVLPHERFDPDASLREYEEWQQFLADVAAKHDASGKRVYPIFGGEPIFDD